MIRGPLQRGWLRSQPLEPAGGSLVCGQPRGLLPPTAQPQRSADETIAQEER